MDKNQQINIE